MAETPKTSFIPKQTGGRVAGRAPRHRRNLSIFNVIVAIVFLAALLLAIGVYVYKGYSERALAEAKSELTVIKNSFSQGDFESIRELDHRMTAAEALLNQHLSPSLIFDLLEARTQSSTQFDGFLYKRNESGSVNIELDGKAARFNTVALQAGQFKESDVLATAIFSDINVDSLEGQSESVTFKVIATADGELIAYQVSPSLDTSAEDSIEEIEGLNESGTIDDELSGIDEALEGIDDALDDGI